MEKAIPPGINYADIKPEAIENQIRIVKFTPIATVQQAQQNDIIRFHLQGNGFYDPYSSYIRIEVGGVDLPQPTAANPFVGKFIDRSAHSFFSRLVLRAQGTELERIEQYDVMASVINDMIYSQEQRVLHHYEGMPTGCTAQAIPNIGMFLNAPGAASMLSLPILYPSSQQSFQTGVGDYGWWKYYVDTATVHNSVVFTGAVSSGSVNIHQCIGYRANGQPVAIRDLFVDANPVVGALFQMKTFAQLVASGINECVDFIDGGNVAAVPAYLIFKSADTLAFTIPIYSGILGVLMPDKKFIPMSLLPLEVEFTINPHALYPVGDLVTNRRYIVKKMEIWTHTLFFEQELHRSLEAVVAENGIFIHYNSFYLTPINTYNAQADQPLPQYNQLGVYLKSISAIHWVFLYSAYEQENGPRKLHFVSHNLSQLQLRNGMDLTPSEPILAQVGGNSFGYLGALGNNHSQFLIETFKAWNKMHDPLTDCNLSPFNYNIDNVLAKPSTLNDYLIQQTRLGRCQYGITLEGEQLGSQRTIICGKKSTMPFDLNISARKSAATVSYMLCFLRADFIVYVRPDLVVTRLGV